MHEYAKTIIPKNLIIPFMLFALCCNAQLHKKLKKADADFKSLSYINAIAKYQDILQSKKPLNELDKVLVLNRLAEASFLVKNYKNAEKYYSELLTGNYNGAEIDPKSYLRYAQVLSTAGNHGESAKMWLKYNELSKSDKRGLGFAKLYSNLEPLTRNAGSYQIEYVGLNTSTPDFSPAYYKNGFVFVSGRNKSNGIKRVFGWDNSNFLDLFYLEDLKLLQEKDKNASLGSGGDTLKTKNTKNPDKLGNDYYTPPTPNDANTIAHLETEKNFSEEIYEELSKIDVKNFSKKINSKYHEGPCTFYDNGQKIIFTRSGQSSNGKLKLYSAERKGNDWTNVSELPFNSDKYSCGHPSMAADNQTLFFASDMPGSLGATDIFYVKLMGKKWSDPVNAGLIINTTGNEIFPFIDGQNNLHFSSDGHPGLGGLDMFSSQLSKAFEAHIVRNLGAPLNSKFDDFGIISNAVRSFGYFSSNRKRGGADDDIYKFTRTGAVYGCRDLIVKLSTVNGPLPNASISYVGADSMTKTATSNQNSIVELCLEADQKYTFTVDINGFKVLRKEYSNDMAHDFEPSRLDLILTPLEKESIVKKPLVNKKDKIVQKRVSSDNGDVFKGIVSSIDGKEPLAGVRLIFKNLCNDQVQEAYSKKDGSYEFDRNPECEYELIASKNDYEESREIITKSIKKTLFGKRKKKSNYSPFNLFDTKIFKVGDVIKLENIYYESESYSIRKNAKNDLDRVLKILQKHPDVLIEISSHTDTRGNELRNLALSQRRAEEVLQYFVSKGIAKNRIRSVGKGESEPLNKCSDGVSCTEAEHQRNRRTEFKIIKLIGKTKNQS